MNCFFKTTGLLIMILFCLKSMAQTVYYDNKTNLYGITNEFGKDILKPTFSEMRIFENGFSKFKQNDKWGLVNEAGVIVVKPTYPSEYDFGVSNEGFISVCKNEKWGYVNSKGELAIDFAYDYTQQFCDGVAWVKLNDKYNFIDTKGKILSDKWFEDVFISKGVSYGKVEGGVFLISKTEKKQMGNDFAMGSRIYCDITNEKLFGFQDKKTGMYGYRDSNKKTIIEPKYNFAFEFADGIALIAKVRGAANNYAVIDENGIEQFQVNNQWSWIEGTNVRFTNGLIEFKDNYASEYILVNKKGEIIKRMKKGVFPSFINR